MEDFSNILRELRKSLKMTQAEFANKTSIGSSTIGEYESGTSKPGYDNLLKIAMTFNVSFDYLLGLTQDKKGDKPINMINFSRPKINGIPITDTELEKITKIMAELIEMIQRNRQ